MNTVAEVMAELKKKGSPLRVRAFAPHGAPKDLFGVSVEDMKVIAKRIKGEVDPIDGRIRCFLRLEYVCRHGASP